MRSHGLVGFVILGLFGCSQTVPAAAQPPPPSSRTATSTTAGSDTKSAAGVALDAAEGAIRAKDLARAARKVEEAKKLAGDRPPPRLVHLETSLHAYAGDYEKAARVLVDHLKTTETRRDDATAFHEHNWLSILRQAQGDLLGALVEADARTRFGEEGTWSSPGGGPGSDRVTLTKLKETWHRAYLLRMHAQQVSGTRKEAVLGYAEEARRAYSALAQPLGGYEDSIAVLEAFFAMHDGDVARATLAARRVDLAKNDDVEDLYLVYSALDAGGAADAAKVVRRRIEGVAYVSFVVPIVRTWIEHDGAPGEKRWSPRNPTGKP